MRPKEICQVEKNKLLVYGESATAATYAFELLEFENNSATKVKTVTLLSTESKQYMMHNCDYTAGAHFRSTEKEEQHAFFDAATNLFHKNDGLESQIKLLSIANSRRGFYVSI